MLPDIALLGRSRSGKDAAADFLVSEYGYQRFRLNEPVRELALALNPLVGKIDGLTARYADALDAFGYESAKDEVPEVRHVLNTIGDAVRGVFGEDVWAAHAECRMDALDTRPVVVTDCRFLPEADLLDSARFRFLRVRRNTEILDNPADRDVDLLTTTFKAREIFNNGDDFDQLHAQLIELIKYTTIWETHAERAG